MATSASGKAKGAPSSTKPVPSTKSNATKVLMKSGHRVLALEAPGDYATLMGTMPAEVVLHEESDGERYDLVHLFAEDKAALKEGVSRATKALKAGGLLWVSYPKQTGSIKTDLNRDICRELMLGLAWNAVTLVALDDTWSAMRYRPVAGDER